MIAAFNTLEKVNLDRVEDLDLRKQIEGILNDVEKMPDSESKAAMAEANQEEIDYLLGELETDFPAALITDVQEKKAPKEQKKESPKAKGKKAGGDAPAEDDQAKREALLKRLNSWEAEFQECKTRIKEYNAAQRALKGPEKKDKPPLHERLNDAIVRIVRMTPVNLQIHEEIQQQNNKIALETKLAFMRNWGLNKSLEKGEKEMLKDLRAVEDKFDERQRRELVKQWSKEMPSDHKIAKVEKGNEDRLKAAKKEVKTYLREAMNHWKENEQAGLEYLREMLSEEQQEAYLPDYIYERL